MIPYGRQQITAEDEAAVLSVLRSPFITQGPAIDEFEQKIADYCGAKFAVAVSSGTSALHIACLALDVGGDDVVWTSPITFVASANCAVYCGATVDFVDINPLTLNIDAELLKKKLVQAEKDNVLPKMLVAVHFTGRPCEMDEISDLCRQYGVAIVEDAAHALGADYGGHKVGNCEHSLFTTFSFHPVKMITTGEGGIVTTNDESLYKVLLRFRSHGITRDDTELNSTDIGGWYYEQLDLGFNYRMTDLQAALGSSQLSKLDSNIALRRERVAQYNEALSGLPLHLPELDRLNESSWHLYVIQIDESKTDVTRRQLFDQLRSSGIGVNVHYIPVYQQPYYRQNGFEGYKLANAENYYNRCLTLPLYPSMTDKEFETVVSAVSRVLQ